MMSEEAVGKGRKNSKCYKEESLPCHWNEMILATSFLIFTDTFSDKYHFLVLKIKGLGMKIR